MCREDPRDIVCAEITTLDVPALRHVMAVAQLLQGHRRSEVVRELDAILYRFAGIASVRELILKTFGDPETDPAVAFEEMDREEGQSSGSPHLVS